MSLPALSVPRTVRLARWNAVLMARNRLALTYGVVVPLLPVLLLLTNDRGEPGVGVVAVSTTVLMAVLFPVFYNVLSQFVTRRDELVLKRMRTGETRDLELLVALVLPGAAVTLLVGLLVVPLAVVLGQDAPLNLPVHLAGILAATVMFAAFAFWTAAWTRNAEAAQMTSLPVILLAIGGQLSAALPDAAQRWADLTPGAALTDLVRSAWFGLAEEGTTRTLDLAATWGEAAAPLTVLLAWTAVAVGIAARSLRWEPRI